MNETAEILQNSVLTNVDQQQMLGTFGAAPPKVASIRAS